MGRILTDIKLLNDQHVRPFKDLRDAYGQQFDLGRYMREHIHMFSSGSTGVRFRIVKRMISDVIDTFGTGVGFTNETDTHVEVVAKVELRWPDDPTDCFGRFYGAKLAEANEAAMGRLGGLGGFGGF